MCLKYLFLFENLHVIYYSGSKDNNIKMQFLPNIYSPSSQIWKIARQKGVIFLSNVLSTHTPMLSRKMQFCPISPLQVVVFEKFQDKSRLFFRWTFQVPTSLCYLKKCSFCPISPLQVVRLEKFHDKRGSFLDKCFEYPEPMLSWNMQFLPRISSPCIQIWKLQDKGG